MALALLAGLATFLVAESASACSVCFGDPNSAMVKGAQAGVLVMLGVVGVMLAGLASLFIFWMRRAANLRTPQVLQSRHVDG
jgi:Na+/proline symporter